MPRGHRTDLNEEDLERKLEEKKEAHKKMTTLQIKNNVEKKAWEALDFYFDELVASDSNAREVAKIAVGTLAIVTKDRQLDIQERILDQKQLPG